MIDIAQRTLEKRLESNPCASTDLLGSWRGKTSRVFILLLINMTLTLTMEIICRELLANFSDEPDFNRFFVPTSTGTTINHQSLINITMTGFATLMGSWVLFGPSFWRRFWYFVSSGLVIAAAAQIFVYFTTTGTFQIARDRAIFDIFYTCLVKFPIFEMGRRSLTRRKTSVVKIFRIRIFQDSAMSAFRISLLNYFKIH